MPANAVEPGWVPTRMGGPRASGDLAAGAETQAWPAVGDGPAARRTGWSPTAPREVTSNLDGDAGGALNGRRD